MYTVTFVTYNNLGVHYLKAVYPNHDIKKVLFGMLPSNSTLQFQNQKNNFYKFIP